MAKNEEATTNEPASVLQGIRHLFVILIFPPPFALEVSSVHSPAMPELIASPLLRRIVLALILLLFLSTNLPWTLDNYDQAKQAYTSFEMVQQGHWLYQHTPNESVATKPPLVGWVSALLFEVTRWWEGAWRLPSLGAALLLVGWIARDATAAYGASAGFIALSAAGLNLLSPRLATLVRTDMPLALVTYLIGAQIWWKIRRAQVWTSRDRWIAFLLLTAALLIKGPIVYAFILPGLIVYEILRRRKGVPPAGWSGFWPWIFSLAIFLLWVWGGIATQPGFYDSVVVREFASRFTETIHRPQPFYFYIPHLLHKFAPWSLLLSGLAIFFWRRREQLSLRMQPDTVWLVCWSVGGLVLMSIIPSKRVDRIFPVLPPFALLLGAQVVAAFRDERWRRSIQPWLRYALLFACLFTGGYAAWRIATAYQEKSDALVTFSRKVRLEAAENHWRYGVVGAREEGMLLYLQCNHFLAPKNAIAEWKTGQVDALVVRDPPARPWLQELPGADLRLTSEKAEGLPRYLLFVRSALPHR